MTEKNDISGNRTKNTWKYLSFVLIGILAFGVAVTGLPKAAAGPPSGSVGEDMMKLFSQIRDTLLGIDEQVNPSKGVNLLKNIELTPNDETQVVVIPSQPDTIYVGTVNFGFAGNAPDRIILDCGFAGGELYDTATDPTTTGHLTFDFACSSLTLRLFDDDGLGLSTQAQVIAGYEEIPAPLET